MKKTTLTLVFLSLLVAMEAAAAKPWTPAPFKNNVSWTAASDANITGVVVADYSYVDDASGPFFVSASLFGNLDFVTQELYVAIPNGFRASTFKRGGGALLKSNGQPVDVEWHTAGTQIVIKRRDGGELYAGPLQLDFVIAIDAAPATAPTSGGGL